VTQRVSVGAAGQSNGFSIQPAISADGRFVAFTSDASNLVPGLKYGTDVFVRDRLARVTRLVSVGAAGEGNDYSTEPAISPDGRFVAFSSLATNLVPGVSEGNVFVRDLLAGVTQVVSVGAAGRATGGSFTPSISAGGRFVAFASAASNLVPGDTNGAWDVFVRDRLAGVTRRVSVASNGRQGNGTSDWPAISADGRYVAFNSAASNLVASDSNDALDVFVRDRLAGLTRRVSVGAAGQANGDSFQPTITADGRSVAFHSIASNLVVRDTNACWDVFVRDPVLDAVEPGPFRTRNFRTSS
jgi:Tol biopolymer transport system component